VNRVLADALDRARELLEAHEPALDELADALARHGRVSFDEILGAVMTVRSGNALISSAEPREGTPS
jgi:hypothetical protein